MNRHDKEGFEQPNAEKAVNQKVQAAARRPGDLGARVGEVSIPMDLMGPAIWTPICTEWLTQTMMWGDGYGLSRPDLYSVSLIDFHHGWRRRANDMSETTKLFFLLLGTYANNIYGPRYYGKAMTLSRRLQAAYDCRLDQRGRHQQQIVLLLPCGMFDGLPVGLKLLGKHFDEPTIYRVRAIG